MSEREPIRIMYFSDVLCVWAYVAQRRLDELIDHFGDDVRVSYHFIPVFGCTSERIGEGWKDRGGFAGFSKHVCDVVGQFEHIEVTTDVWRSATPESSASAHHFLKAVEVVSHDAPNHDHGGRTLLERAAWRLREAFFREGRDIAQLETQLVVASELGLAVDAVRAAMEDGRAMAQLFRDIELRDQHQVRGSPTYILNEGRQILYGNVGYRVIEANVEEILHRPESQASWC